MTMIDVRTIETADLPMIRQWAEARRLTLPEALLSPYGFLAEDGGRPLLAVWAYMLFDVPVIQLDNLYSAPQSTIAEVRLAWGEITLAVMEWMRQIKHWSGKDYTILRGFMNERLANEARGFGWHVGGERFAQIFHALT